MPVASGTLQLTQAFPATFEQPVLIVKKDGQREVLSIEKLRSGLLKAVHRRPVTAKQLDAIIEEVRGEGLFLGLKLKPPVGDVQKACFKELLLVIPAGDNVLRLLPPLTLTDTEMATAFDRLTKAFSTIAKGADGAGAKA